MHKYNHIKALFFLGIFSMLLLHQVLPHSHHEHNDEHTHKSVAHGDTHSHHHDVPEKESPSKGFLDLFLEMHMHSVVSNDILFIQERSVIHLVIKKLIATSVSVIHSNIFINYDEADNIRIYHPPKIYFNRYLSSLDSRGPPNLG